MRRRRSENSADDRLNESIPFDALIEAMNNGFSIIDQTGVFTYVNNRLAEILEYDAAYLIGKSYQEFLDDENIAIVEKHLETRKQGVSSQYELRWISKSGRPIFTIVSGTPNIDDAGKHNGAYAIMTDITERKQAEETLQTSVDLFQELFQETPIGILLCDTKGRILKINKRGLMLLGSPAEEATKEINLLTFPPLKEVGASDALKECIKRQVSIEDEKSYTTKWGKPVVFRYKFTPLLDEDGNTTGVLCTFEDVRSFKESEEKISLYREIIAQSNDAIAILNLKGEYVEQNFAHEKLIGYTNEELENETPAIHFGNDVFQMIFVELSKSGRYRGEVESRIKNGNLLIIDLSAFVIKDSSGTPLYYVGIKRDITTEKRAEGELRRSEALLAEAQRVTSLGSWEWDIENDREYWSDEVYRIFGVQSNEFPATFEAFLSYVHPEDRETVRQAVSDAVDLGEPYDIGHRILRPDGTVRYVHEQGEVTFDDSHKAVRMIGTVHDITEKLLAEMALRESEELYRLHFENATDVIVALDTVGRIVKISPSVERQIGYSPEELVGKTFLEVPLLTPEYTDIAVSDFQSILRGETLSNVVYEFVRRTGKKRFGEISGSSLKERGRDEAVLVIRDVTERVMTERALTHATDVAFLYLDLMSHDISNQLQVIIGGASIIQEMVDDVYVTNQLENILESAERCSRIVTKVKSTRDLMTIPLVTIQLDKKLEECIREYANKTENAEIIFDSQVTDALISADQFLDVLLCILVENSILHNPKEEKMVWITLREEELVYSISIADNGPGLSDKQKLALFDMSRRYGGVGLHQAKQIVAKYHGQISIQDRVQGNPSEGAEFIVLLPKMTME